MCDRWDIGGLSTNVHFQTGRSTIFIYDGHPGGVGITQRGYEQFERLLGDAERLIAECPCESGCPSCVQSPKCGNLNEPLHKAGRAGADGADEGSAVKGGSGARRHEQRGGSGRGPLPPFRARSSGRRHRLQSRASWLRARGGWPRRSGAAGRGRGGGRLRRAGRGDGGGLPRARRGPAGRRSGSCRGDSVEEANPYCTQVVATGDRPRPQPRRRRLRRGRDRDRRRVGDALGDRLRPRDRPHRGRPAQLGAERAASGWRAPPAWSRPTPPTRPSPLRWPRSSQRWRSFGPSRGQSSRRARIAKAWDQASGVVERGMPVRASTRSGRAPAGVAARRRAASRCERLRGARRARRGSRRSRRSAPSRDQCPGPGLAAE